ncbi:MAG TPA: hypothetical protein VI756_30120 [Blastocatellia bacterium]
MGDQASRSRLKARRYFFALTVVAIGSSLILYSRPFARLLLRRGDGGSVNPVAALQHKQARSGNAPDAIVSAAAAQWMLAAARVDLDSRHTQPARKIPDPPPEVLNHRDTKLFLTLYGYGQAVATSDADQTSGARLPNQIAPRSQGVGVSLKDALEKAESGMVSATAGRTAHTLNQLPDRTRLKLDVMAGEPELVDKPADGDDDSAEDLIDAGSDGLEIDSPTTTTYLMPSDLIYDSILTANPGAQDGTDLLDRAMEAAGLPKDFWQSSAVKLYTFQTASYVEDASQSRALPIVRGFVLRGDTAPASLVADARAGGDYLIRIQKRSGEFDYVYDALRDSAPGNHYNIIRHAGTAIALFDLYRATKDRRYLDAGTRAVDYLKTRFQAAPSTKAAPSPFGNPAPRAIYVLDYDGKSRLGANGLALLALTREMQSAPRPGDTAAAKGLAQALINMQRADGSLNMYYATDPDEEEGYSLYYPGEAMLGLIELYKLTHDPRLLDTVRRGADYLIDSERKQKVLPPDAWFVQALEALHEFDQSKKYTDHAIDLGLEMISEQYTPAAPLGFEGAISPGTPRATPAGSRAEGTLAAYRIARALGDGRAAQILAGIKSSAGFQVSQQFGPENSFFLPDPGHAAGGFHESIISMHIRIDYVQHNICSLLGLAALNR